MQRFAQLFGLAAACAQDEVRPLPGIDTGDPFADPFAGAGDQRRLSAQFSHHAFLLYVTIIHEKR